jgi:hypothetical protein
VIYSSAYLGFSVSLLVLIVDSGPSCSFFFLLYLQEKESELRDFDLSVLVEGVRGGFTVDNCHLVTIAHLDLMLEKKSHVRLMYEWRHRGNPSGSGGAATVGSGVVAMGSGSDDAERMTNMMRRLSGMAMMEYRDIVQRGVRHRPLYCDFFWVRSGIWKLNNGLINN